MNISYVYTYNKRRTTNKWKYIFAVYHIICIDSIYNCTQAELDPKRIMWFLCFCHTPSLHLRVDDFAIDVLDVFQDVFWSLGNMLVIDFWSWWPDFDSSTLAASQSCEGLYLCCWEVCALVLLWPCLTQRSEMDAHRHTGRRTPVEFSFSTWQRCLSKVFDGASIGSFALLHSLACSDALIPVPGPELLEQVRKGCQRMTLETCPWAHRTSRNQEDEIA